MQRAHLCMLSAGFGLGVAAGLLFAPKAGKKTRSQITEAVMEGANSAKKHGHAIGHSAVAVVKRGKVPIMRTKSRLGEAIRRSTWEYKQVVGLY